MIKRTETTIEKATIETGRPGKRVKRMIGKDNPADMEERETYRVEKRTTIKTTNAKPAILGSMAKATPNRVATPLPPLNPAKTGKIWPITAATPRAI